MKSFDFFGLGLEDAFGFAITLIEDVEDGFLWRANTDHGQACLKRFLKKSEIETSTRAAIYVHDRGFTGTPRLIPASSGQRFVRSPMTDPVWYMALFEWVPGEGEKPAPTLGEWRGQVDRDSEEYRRSAEEFGRALGRFHLSARGFQSWPTDREADFWIWNFGAWEPRLASRDRD